MRLITRELLAKTAADRFNKFYGVDTRFEHDPRRQKACAALIELGERATPEQVHKIIGNDSWTWTQCHECGASNIPVIELGQEPDYDSATASVCLPCLQKAALLIVEDLADNKK